MPSFPASLPPPEHRGLSETPQNAVLRSDMDMGPAKQRPRFTAASTYLDLSYLLTLPEMAVFETFFITDTLRGAVAFDYSHPRTGSTVQARFREPPVYTPDSRKLWRVACKLEILP
jgi:hypothetical protein